MRHECVYYFLSADIFVEINTKLAINKCTGPRGLLRLYLLLGQSIPHMFTQTRLHTYAHTHTQLHKHVYTLTHTHTITQTRLHTHIQPRARLLWIYSEITGKMPSWIGIFFNVFSTFYLKWTHIVNNIHYSVI